MRRGKKGIIIALAKHHFPQSHYMDKKILTLFAISFLAMLVAFVINRVSFKQMHGYVRIFDHAQNVSLTLGQITQRLKMAQAYFILPGQDENRSAKEYIKEIDAIRKEVASLQSYQYYTEQAKRIDTIFYLMSKIIQWDNAQLRKNKELKASSKYIEHLQKVEAVAQRAIAHATKVLDERRESLGNSLAKSDRWTLILFAISLFFIGITVSYMVLMIFGKRKAESFLESVLQSSLNAIINYTTIRSADKQIIDFRLNYIKPHGNEEADDTPFMQMDATFLQQFPESSCNGEFDRMKKVVQTGKTDIYEVRTGSGDNTKWYKVKLVRMNDGLTASFINITDIKSTQEQLEAYVKKLEQSNIELEQFASIASHDLQEPLRKIQTFSDTLRKHPVVQGETELIRLSHRIIETSERMRNLIDALLDFSRISNTRHRFKRTDLNKVIQHVLNDLAVMIQETGAEVSFDYLPAIDVVPLQIHQLFYNLINNALKFRKADISPEVFIQWETTSPEVIQEWGLLPNSEYIKITVSDNGIGFNDKYAKDIFLPFKRLHTWSDFKGSGIGLAICKKIVNNHGGEIFAESKGGGGASFIIFLPVTAVVDRTDE